MAKAKQTGLGTTLQWDETGGSSFTNVTLVRAITPPPRTRERVDGRDLGDEYAVELPGYEESSDMVFTEFYQTGETESEKMHAAFDSKVDANWQIHDPLQPGDSTAAIREFTGKVMGVSDAEIVGSGVYEREITVHRTSAITVTPAVPTP